MLHVLRPSHHHRRDPAHGARPFDRETLIEDDRIKASVPTSAARRDDEK